MPLLFVFEIFGRGRCSVDLPATWTVPVCVALWLTAGPFRVEYVFA